jgi:predicted dehydrogenase
MINAGIAGLGRWGRVLIDSVQGKSDLIKVTAGCTGRRHLAEDYCVENEIDLRGSLDDLLNDDSLDAIILATPHGQHREQVIACAKAGKQIFIEKPFTLTKTDAIEALDACKNAGVICAIGHNRRFLTSMARLRDMTTTGELGTILHIEAQFHADGGLNYTNEHWRASDSESPAGGMTGLGIHSIDALISFLGPITEVTAVSERRVMTVPIDDTTFFTMRFASGATGYFSTCFATPRDWRIQVLGDKGWAEMRGHEKLTTSMRGGSEEVTSYDVMDIERAELEAFANACTGGEPYPIPWSDIIHATAVLEAVVTSAKTGETVKL